MTLSKCDGTVFLALYNSYLADDIKEVKVTRLKRSGDKTLGLFITENKVNGHTATEYETFLSTSLFGRLVFGTFEEARNELKHRKAEWEAKYA